MYKLIGIGLLCLVALIVIPVSSETQSDDPSMYGITTVALKDDSGNILFENEVHNEVVDEGTAFMLANTFQHGFFDFDLQSQHVDALCVSDADPFSTLDTETHLTFNADNTISGPFKNCIGQIDFQLTNTSASTGTQNFSPPTHFLSGTTITGIGVCRSGDPGAGNPSALSLDCGLQPIGVSAVLIGVVDIPDTTVFVDSTLSVTYTMNLD